MRRITISVLLMLFFIEFSSCEAKFEINGPWISKVAYDIWKNEASEDLVATVGKIGNTNYLILTNSIIINTYKNPGIFQVPGGKWRILKVDSSIDTKILLHVGSIKNDEALAVIKINFLTENTIFFTVVSMNKKFIEEFQQSFLQLGDENIYIRCDKQ